MKMEMRSRAIDKMFKRRNRIDMPDFQREEVWDTGKKQLLIDSILKGWHLPKFYFRKIDENTFDCVDGQQRLSAIFEFFDGRLTLASNTARSLNATGYSDLPDAVSDAFDDYEIDIEEIEDASDNELEELFRRLQLGTPLNAAEKLNAIGGGLKDFCHQVANSSFFANKVSLRDARYAHFEISARWLFIESRGILPQVRFPQLEGFLRENRTFSQQSETAKRISFTLDYLDEAFPEKCKLLTNRTNILSVCMLASRVVNQGISKNSAQVFGDFVTKFLTELTSEVEKGVDSTETELLRYQQAISVGSADGPSIQTRINILSKRLATYASEFRQLLGAYIDAEDEAIRNLVELSEVARNLIFGANRKYAGINGEDLFKMTTNSAEAVTRLQVACKTSDAFETFIDDLFFLVYEGSGSCERLGDPPPEFAMDVKFLRTSARHDLDHGTKSEIRRKQTRSADVFRKYSGKATLGECSPAEILAAQVNILEELSAFLKSLN